MDLESFKEGLRRDIIKANGHVVVELVPVGHAQCPKCGKIYKFSKEPGKGEPWEREQHLGGYCSDSCWPLPGPNDDYSDD